MTVHSAIDYPGPLLGEPLPLELANTRYLVRGRHPHDGLESIERFGAWLAQVRSRLRIRLSDDDLRTVHGTELTLVRDLRDCVHELATASIEHQRPSGEVINRLNRHARAAPEWSELRWDARPTVETRSGAAPATAAISEIAVATVELFSSPGAANIRSCPASGCILYFVKDHARREWCSTACGNRVRAARHYERQRHSAPSPRAVPDQITTDDTRRGPDSG